MPFDDFTWSARTLSDDDIAQQMLDTQTIMYHLVYATYGWDNDHPAVSMWEGHERALLAYQQAMCSEWSLGRGHKDTAGCWDTTRAMFLDVILDPMAAPLIPPAWMGNVDFHLSHQAYLLRKDNEFYRKKFPGNRTERELIWPVHPIKENT